MSLLRASQHADVGRAVPTGALWGVTQAVTYPAPRVEGGAFVSALPRPGYAVDMASAASLNYRPPGMAAALEGAA